MSPARRGERIMGDLKVLENVKMTGSIFRKLLTFLISRVPFLVITVIPYY
jgi:hypothetical protein